MFKTYQKKPVQVKVLHYSNTPNINTFLVEVTKDSITPATLEDGKVKFKTLEGDMTVSEGDYVICGTNGEFYPIKPEIFEQCYETEDNLPHATVPSLLDKKGFSPKYWVAMFPGDTDVIIKTAHKCLMDSQALAQELFDEDQYEQLVFITIEVSAVNAVKSP